MDKVFLEKLATFMHESGQTAKHATELAKKLLKDNEELSEKIASLEAEKHEAERKAKIAKIVELLNKNGLVAKSDMDNKIKQLEDANDEFIDYYMNELSNLHGNAMPKEAAENTFSTLKFMTNVDVSESDEKLNFLTAFSK